METTPKLSFCLTDQEAKAIEQARQRLGRHGILRNRSEVIRAAIGRLRDLTDEELVAAAEKPAQLRPGRRKSPSRK